MRKILLCILLFPASLIHGAGENLYGSTSARDYLSGRFNPAKHELFISCSAAGIPTDGRNHYLRKDTAYAFARLVRAFQADHPKIKLFVKSSTRNFYYQKAIWEGKFSGKRKVDGKNLSIAIPDTYRRALKILEYSSMPGTSRHHWGTDLDINSLVNSYFSSGEGRIIYQWMREHAADYGFYQVYTPGREGGYNDEMWHWSYLPVARLLYHDWIRYFGDSTSYFSDNSFEGSEHAQQLARYYVEQINPECK